MFIKQKTTKLTLPLLALFLFWQTELVLHLSLIPHTICEHGKIVDADPVSGLPQHEKGDKNNPNHESCRFLAMLTSAKTRTTDYSNLSKVVGTPQSKAFVYFNDITIYYKEELFRLSPSNSPPNFSR
jgi:hypothetical protein